MTGPQKVRFAPTATHRQYPEGLQSGPDSLCESNVVNKSLILKSALALALATPLMASADSQVVVGTGSAAANLDFRVVIPRILLLQVGDASNVDLVDFDLSLGPIEPGTGGPVGRTNGGVVPVRVVGNDGNITLASAGTSGGLANGPDTIAWSAITATSSDPAFDSPAPAGASVGLTPNVGARVTNRTANWTFTYANNTVVAEGTYTGSVTYTATMP